MPTLAKKFFKATGELPLEYAARLETAGLGLPIHQTLIDLGWTGKLVAGVGLELSPDNKQVRRGEFFLRGLPTKEFVEIQASNLWSTASNDITLTLSIPDAGHFRFSSGTLACENFRHSFAKAGNIITPNQWEDNGVGEVSLQAVCHLDKLSNGRQGPAVKVTFLILPCNTDQLIELSDSTQSPAWPGLRILESTAEFFPKIPGWEDPICPLLIRGSARGEAPDLPTGQDLRFHTAEIMKTAKRPTVCTKLKALERQWKKALEDVEELEQEPTITWPSVPRPAPPIGNRIVYSTACNQSSLARLINILLSSFLSYLSFPIYNA
jgi:hypothetical protein